MHIGKRLRFLRDQKDMTQADLAKMLGVSRVTVTNWETDRAVPFYEAVIKMADYFEVTTDYILGLILGDPERSGAIRKGHLAGFYFAK